jgi:Uma2 family endonuclease
MEDVMSMLAEHRSRAWDFQELGDLPDDGHRYEVVDGNLHVTPPPSQNHQFLSNRLAKQLQAAAPAEWEVFVEMALPLGRDGRVPDVSVIRGDADFAAGSVPYPTGAEAFGLVVEVVSERTAKTDRFAKPGEYAAAGIRCFWRVERSPELQVHGFELVDGAYVETDGPLPVPWGRLALDLSVLR